MIFPFILSCKPRLIKIQFISASLCGIVHCFESVRWTFFKIGFNRFGQCHETSCIINTILNKFQILSFHCFHFYQPLSFTPFLSHLRRSSNPRFLDRCLLLTTERCVTYQSSAGSFHSQYITISSSFTDAFLPSPPHSTSIRLALRRLCYRRCLIAETYPSEAIIVASL